MALLECRQISKQFGGVRALERVDASVEEGTIVALIGPNGAGKTTLFNMIAGTFRPTSGRVAFEGDDITGLSPHLITRRGMARTFQIARPFLEMNCLENVGVAVVNCARNHAGAGWRRAARTILERVEMDEYADTPAKNLNVVQKKRLEIARALATRPRLLLLDEVLGGLNTQEIGQSIRFIRTLRDERNITVFWIEHVMGAVMETAEKVIVLDQGSTLMEGTPAEVVRDPGVIRAYLGE